jgi:hypothetical protein
MMRSFNPLLALLLLLLVLSCGEDVTPPEILDLDLVDGPAPPHATIGDGMLTLDWTLAGSEAELTRVYKKVWPTGEEWLAASTGDSVWVDATVSNDSVYGYRLATVSDTGIESLRSSWAVLQPALFTVSINSDQIQTASYDVELRFALREDVSWVRVGAAPELEEAIWLQIDPDSAFLDWQLPGPDGYNTVYAQLRDLRGNFSEPIQDDILLDTQAAISDLVLFPIDSIVRQDYPMDFYLYTDELGGQAHVVLEFDEEIHGREPVIIALFDDGQGVDARANDGVYSQSQLFVEGVFIANEVEVTGHFTDALGNAALPYLARHTLSFDTRPPLAGR